MTKQHTPGPWTVEGHTVNARGVAYGFANSTASAHELRANARLIAAAPDMLAALRLAAHTLDFAQSIVTRAVDSDTFLAALTAARVAINKAEEG